jgi:hypothetical protein
MTTPTPIVYPPLHPEKNPYDPSTSTYWPYYTAEERNMLLNHPKDEVALEITLMRSEIAEVLKAQQKDPCKTPQESLSTLYTIAVAARTIGTLVKYQSDYNQTHNKWDKILAEAKHIALIRTGNYRLMAKMGFAVPEGVLEIEPDLLPNPAPIPGWVPPQTNKSDADCAAITNQTNP